MAATVDSLQVYADVLVAASKQAPIGTYLPIPTYCYSYKYTGSLSSFSVKRGKRNDVNPSRPYIRRSII